VPKHVGVFVCVTYITLLRAFVGKFIDCRNMGGKNFGNILEQGYTNLGVQVAVATKCFKVTSNICVSSVGTCFMTPFWRLKF